MPLVAADGDVRIKKLMQRIERRSEDSFSMSKMSPTATHATTAASARTTRNGGYG